MFGILLIQVQVLDKTFEIFIPGSVIEKRIAEIADKINKDYAGKEVLFIPILNGAVLFASELMKRVTIPCQFSFVKIKTYHNTESTGNFNRVIGLTEDISNKHLIILEDIVDTGFTMAHLLRELKQDNPLSVAVCTLLVKPKASNSSIKIDYLGFEIEDKFVLGYGLDYDGYGRNLPDLYILKQ